MKPEMGDERIIFNGDEIVARYVMGRTRYLLITFMGACHESEAETNYLLRDFVQSTGANCIGITTRFVNFYISSEMDQVLRLVSDIRTQFHQVIVVGLSIGAYAAIKYSAALQADYVLAFSPYYSIDTEELEITSEIAPIRLRMLEAAGLVNLQNYKGMAPKPTDVSGSVFIVYDREDVVDRFSARSLEASLPGVTGVPLTHVGHLTNEPYFKLLVMLKIIDVLLTGNSTDVRNVFLKVARQRASHAESVLSVAARRKPTMALRALHSIRFSDTASQDALRSGNLGGMLMYEFALRGQSDKVDEAFTWATDRKLHSGAEHNAADATGAQLRAGAYLLLTYHFRLIFFDIVTRKLVQKDGMRPRASLRPLALTGLGGEQLAVRAVCFLGGREKEVNFDAENGGPYLIEGVGPGVHAISTINANGEQRYLRSDPNGSIGFHASTAGGFEHFVLVPTDGTYLTQQESRKDDWLDNVLERSSELTNSQPANIESPNKSARAVGRWWTRLGISRSENPKPRTKAS